MKKMVCFFVSAAMVFSSIYFGTFAAQGDESSTDLLSTINSQGALPQHGEQPPPPDGQAPPTDEQAPPTGEQPPLGVDRSSPELLSRPPIPPFVEKNKDAIVNMNKQKKADIKEKRAAIQEEFKDSMDQLRADKKLIKDRINQIRQDILDFRNAKRAENRNVHDSVYDSVYNNVYDEANLNEMMIELKDMLQQNKDSKKHIVKQAAREKKEANDHSIPVVVGGNSVKFDVPPVIKDGRTLVPVRAVVTALGAQVDWNDETKTATITKSVYKDVYNADTGTVYSEPVAISIKVKLGSDIIKSNDNDVKIDVPAQIVGGRIVVPIRYIAEILNQDVEWDPETSSVVIEDTIDLSGIMDKSEVKKLLSQ